MYTATIYTVSIVSPGVTIEEEHIARETLNRWNAEKREGERQSFPPAAVGFHRRDRHLCSAH